MGAKLLDRHTNDASGTAAQKKEERSERARHWLEGSIANWGREGRITEAEEAKLYSRLGEPTLLALLPHFGVHLAIGAVLRFPIGSITRASYTALNLLLATLRLLVRNIDRRQWRQALSIHSPLVILIAGMPGIGTFAYLAAKPVCSNHLMLRIALDTVLLKFPLRVYERTGLRWIVARPKAADLATTTAKQQPLKVHLWAQDVMLVLGCMVGALAAADFISQTLVELGFIDPAAFLWEAIVPRLDLNEESSFGTWYAGISLAFLAALLGAIAFAKVRGGDRFKWHWVALAVLPLGFSIDEVAKLHDPGGGNFHRIRDQIGLSGPLLYSWVIAGMVSVVLIGLVYRHFIAGLPRTTRKLYLLAAALFVAGEVIVEMGTGWYLDSAGEKDLIYQTMTTIEESLSMAGILVAIAGTLHYIQSTFGEIRIRLSGEREPAARADSQVPAAPPSRELAPQPVMATTVDEAGRRNASVDRPSAPAAV